MALWEISLRRIQHGHVIKKRKKEQTGNKENNQNIHTHSQPLNTLASTSEADLVRNGFAGWQRAQTNLPLLCVRRKRDQWSLPLGAKQKIASRGPKKQIEPTGPACLVVFVLVHFLGWVWGFPLHLLYTKERFPHGNPPAFLRGSLPL